MLRCELWILERKDIQILQSFQRYAARRIQRLHLRSLNLTSRVCLGWMDIIRYIMAKKALFIRTVFTMKDYIPIRAVLVESVLRDDNNIEMENAFNSPIIDLLNACHTLNLMHLVRDMARGAHYSKEMWKKTVWGNAWVMEVAEWHLLAANEPSLDLINKVTTEPVYSIWWQMSDGNRSILRKCETMVRILCKATLLKDDDCRLKGQPLGSRMCIRCEFGCPRDRDTYGYAMPFQCPS